MRNPGGDLLSQGASPQVPSARADLTAVFGMGTGVSPPLWPPETVRSAGLPHPVCWNGDRACGCVTAAPERSKASTSSKSQALGRLVPVG
jgi:hypothetical protein